MSSSPAGRSVSSGCWTFGRSGCQRNGSRADAYSTAILVGPSGGCSGRRWRRWGRRCLAGWRCVTRWRLPPQICKVRFDDLRGQRRRAPSTKRGNRSRRECARRLQRWLACRQGTSGDSPRRRRRVTRGRPDGVVADQCLGDSGGGVGQHAADDPAVLDAGFRVRGRRFWRRVGSHGRCRDRPERLDATARAARLSIRATLPAGSDAGAIVPRPGRPGGAGQPHRSSGAGSEIRARRPAQPGHRGQSRQTGGAAAMPASRLRREHPGRQIGQQPKRRPILRRATAASPPGRTSSSGVSRWPAAA